MHENLRQITADLKGSWRFRWKAVWVAWIICVLGWLVVYALPDNFESEATIYVDTSSALKPLLERLTVGSDVLDRVELVTKAMLGRPILEKVARENDLHLRVNSKKDMDELVISMRRRFSVENNPRMEPNLFIIRFRDENAAMAQAIVSSMLSIFVEDSLGANRLDTINAQKFLRDELSKLEVDLETSEAELAAFKKRNVGQMPGESGDYFARLQSAIDNLEITRSGLQLAIRRRDALRRQLNGEQPMLDSSSGIQSELDQRLSDNRTRLEELQLRFTDQHPDVIATQNILAQLEEQKRKESERVLSGDGTGIASDNPVFQNIQIELTTVSVEIETLLQQQSTQERRIQELRDLVDVLPQVEAELSRLTRDYDVKQTQYQSLLQRLEVAELSESAEQSEQVQFRVIDPPLFPAKPVTPNRPLLLFGVLVLGLGAGGGLSFLGNRLKPVFQDSISLRAATGLPVLGSVSIMRTPERRQRRIHQLASFSMAIAALCFFWVILLLLHEPGSSLMRSLIGKGV